MYFEGSEKKLEISLKQGSKSLKSFPKSFWDALVKMSGAKIVGSISSPLCDSYVLSDSSLFVFPQKVILITCGKTRLVSFVREFLNFVRLEDFDSFFYEFKNEKTPGLQTKAFYQDCEELARMMPGQAYRIGEDLDQHLYLFHMDKASSLLKSSEATLEILMNDLSLKVRDARKAIAENADFKMLFDSFDIHDHLFEHNGYSLNAIKGDKYFTFRVKTEEFGSYASFETNSLQQGQDDGVGATLQAMRSIFQPRSMQVVSFDPGRNLDFASLENTAVKSKVVKNLSNGFQLQYFSVVEKGNAKILESIELPKFVETKVAAPAAAKAPIEGDWRFDKVGALALGHKLKGSVFQHKSEAGKVEIVETEALGKTLMKNDHVLCSEQDEFIASEMMAHVPLFVHPNPNRVLIVGGGDLSCAKEVLKHNSVQECLCLESDAQIAEASKDHFEWSMAVLTDPRFNIQVGDVEKYLGETENLYDLILVNTLELNESFYDKIKNVLAPGGMLVSRAASPYTHATEQAALKATLTKHFSRVMFYNYSNLSSLGGLQSLILSGDNFHPLEDYDRERVQKSSLGLKYYNAEIHFAAFFLPSFMKKKPQAQKTDEVTLGA